MTNQEHIHFIISGENIHNTYHLVIKNNDITRTYVIVEEDICKNSPKDGDNRRVLKEKIRCAIREIGTISKTVKISYGTIRIDSVTLESVRDAVLEIFTEYPDARFSFNISGGTKVLSIGLFLMSVWLQGDVYYTPTDSMIQKLAIPKMQSTEIEKNKNYVEILKCLAPTKKGKEKAVALEKPGKELFLEMKKVYKPVRDIGDKKTKRELRRGTLTKLLSTLMGWGLVIEKNKPGNKRELLYSISPDGEFALKFFLIQQKKTNPVQQK